MEEYEVDELGQRIFNNGYIKLVSPVNLNGTTYSGNYLCYDFGDQKNNFEKFTNLIKKYGIEPLNIEGVIRQLNNKKSHEFILTTTKPGLIWRRYKGPSVTSNVTYFKKEQIKLVTLLETDKNGDEHLREYDVNKLFQLLDDPVNVKYKFY